jgi:hypothetical protein
MVNKQDKPKMNTTVFEYFRKLTNKNEKVRITGAAALIEHLEKTSEEKVNNAACWMFKKNICCMLKKLNISRT